MSEKIRRKPINTSRSSAEDSASAAAAVAASPRFVSEDDSENFNEV